MSAPTAQPAQPAPLDLLVRQAAPQALQGQPVLQVQAYPAPPELQVLEPQVPQVLALPVLQAPLVPLVLVQPALREPRAHKAPQECLAS